MALSIPCVLKGREGSRTVCQAESMKEVYGSPLLVMKAGKEGYQPRNAANPRSKGTAKFEASKNMRTSSLQA